MIPPYEQYLSFSPAPLSEFGANFSSFRQTAFRLELLAEYDVAEEEEARRAYAAGKERPEDFNSDWHKILTSAGRRGATVQRCRLIAERTEYLDFEIAWGYRFNQKDGEDIRQINREQLKAGIVRSGLVFIQDFWLFDNDRLYLMNYDFLGRFLGVAKGDEDIVQRFTKLSALLYRDSSDIGPQGR